MNDKTYLIGIDGGGTKTKCVLTDFELKVIDEVTGGPSNFLMIGTETVSSTILDLITQLIKRNNLIEDNIASIMIGTTGAGRIQDAEKLKNAFIDYSLKAGIVFNQINVESDARIALEGAFEGKPGSILIAGTGSVMFGKDSKGNIHRVGGFGRFIGDEGSGNYIGKLGLQNVAKEMDGRGGKTILTKMLENKYNITSFQDLIFEIYTNKFEPSQITPLVIDAASKNDSVCLSIINNNIEELILHINAMFIKLCQPILNVSLIGSTLTTDNFYATSFKNRVNTELSNIQLKKPILSPDLGAALMAKNIFLQSVNNIQDSYE